MIQVLSFIIPYSSTVAFRGHMSDRMALYLFGFGLLMLLVIVMLFYWSYKRKSK